MELIGYGQAKGVQQRDNPTVSCRGITPRWKWQDKVESFQGVKHQALELVPELGPSFEEVKEEKAQTKELKEEENPDKGKQQMLLGDVKEPSA
jgi:hypothetical protein